VYLYHNAQSQYDSIRHVPMSQLQPGDLVFYGSSSGTIDHVAIYVGGGTVVHAPHTGARVQLGPVYLWGGYYAWTGAGRPS
jgi:cell wall-associated NlpC family hydrolase